MLTHIPCDVNGVIEACSDNSIRMGSLYYHVLSISSLYAREYSVHQGIRLEGENTPNKKKQSSCIQHFAREHVIWYESTKFPARMHNIIDLWTLFINLGRAEKMAASSSEF